MLAIAWLVVILMSLTVHEFAHALVGRMLGDITAEREGRLTLNPLAHLDPLGFLMLLFVGFGWAKPVPFDPRYLKHPARDATLIAFAGPLVNVLLALVAGGLFAGLVVTGIVSMTSLLAIFLVLLVYMNGILAVFNIIPLPPLDGSKLVQAFLAVTRQRALEALYVRVGPVLLILLVILSSGAGVPVFTFITYPVSYFCGVLLGPTCVEVFMTALGGS